MTEVTENDTFRTVAALGIQPASDTCTRTPPYQTTSSERSQDTGLNMLLFEGASPSCEEMEESRPLPGLVRRMMLPRPLLLCLQGLLLGRFTQACPPPCQCYDGTKVFCSGEEIWDIPEGLPGNATQLFFVETSLTTIGSGLFSNHSSLARLVFLNNPSLSLEAGAFGERPSLTELEVSGSNLSALSSEAFGSLLELRKLSLTFSALRALEPGLFNRTPGLEALHLQGNQIEALPPKIFSPLRELRVLDLSHNPMAQVPDRLFDPLARLQVLKLSNISLARLPLGTFRRLRSLQELSLDRNALADLPPGAFSGLTHLRRLQLQHNALTGLRPYIFSCLPSLDFLNLEGNRLSALPAGLLRGTPKLSQLFAASNRLETIPEGIFSNLLELQTIVLSHNRLTHLPAGAFRDLSGLTTLQLDHNNLTALAGDAFHNLTSLEVLDLTGNRLQALPEGIFDFNDYLLGVAMKDNPWVCDCRLASLASWIRTWSAPLNSQTFCASPDHLKGWALPALPQEQLVCLAAPGQADSSLSPGEAETDRAPCTYSDPEGTVQLTCDAAACHRLTVHLPPQGASTGQGPAYDSNWVLNSSCGRVRVSVAIRAEPGGMAREEEAVSLNPRSEP
ncbi:unnamed protein product [Caretta caretta]